MTAGPPVRLAPAVDAPGRAQRRARVLVVDDDEAVRAALEAVLADAGYRVALAADGLEALATLADARDPVRVVLLDLMMPNGSGWHVLAGLPAARGVRPPVVVVTALDPAHVRLPATVERVLRKPFAVDEVLAAVGELAGDPEEPASRG